MACARRIGAVPSEQRKPSAPGRSPEQRLRALEKANQVRRARVIAEPPPCTQTARVRELLLVVPGIGPARASRALTHCRIADTKTVSGLSSRQRTELIELLCR